MAPEDVAGMCPSLGGRVEHQVHARRVTAGPVRDREDSVSKVRSELADHQVEVSEPRRV